MSDIQYGLPDRICSNSWPFSRLRIRETNALLDRLCKAGDIEVNENRSLSRSRPLLTVVAVQKGRDSMLDDFVKINHGRSSERRGEESVEKGNVHQVGVCLVQSAALWPTVTIICVQGVSLWMGVRYSSNTTRDVMDLFVHRNGHV
jgi:hypothetical protein